MEGEMKKEIKMIFKLILYLTIVLLLINSAISQEVIDMELVVYKNNSVDEHWIHFSEGLPSIYYQQDGNYRLTVVNQNGNELFIQPIQFIFDYDGSVRSGYDYSGLESEALLFDFAIPYNPDMRELRLYHGDKLIFSKVLNFCDNDGICGSSETFESCPQDCPLNRNDVICLPDEDGFCDPDCWQGVDPDCEDEFYPFAGENKEVKAGRPVSFEGEVGNAGSGTYTYSWFFEDDGSTRTGREVTHTFVENGVFAVTLTVTNQAGVHKEDTLLVTVSDAEYILSPRGGDVWRVGKTYTIKWLTDKWPYGSSPADPIVISLITNIGNNSYGTEMPFAVTTNTGSYDWTVPSELPFYHLKEKLDGGCCELYDQKFGIVKLGAGNVYKIEVTHNPFSTYAYPPNQPTRYSYISANKFSIVTSSGEPLPITVLMPNGKGLWRIGENLTIEWIAPNYPSTTSVNIRLVAPLTQWPYTPKEMTISSRVQNSGSFSWIIPSWVKDYMDTTCSPCELPELGTSFRFCQCGSSFKIKIEVSGSSDESDSEFTIQDVGTHLVSVFAWPPTVKQEEKVKMSWDSNLYNSKCRIWFGCGSQLINNLPESGDYDFTASCSPYSYALAARCFSPEIVVQYKDTTTIPDEKGVSSSTTVGVTAK